MVAWALAVLIIATQPKPLTCARRMYRHPLGDLYKDAAFVYRAGSSREQGKAWPRRTCTGAVTLDIEKADLKMTDPHWNEHHPDYYLDESDYFGEDPKADLAYWGKMGYWTSDEGVALSFGYSPAVVSISTLKGRDHPFVSEYMRRMELISRARGPGPYEDRLQPSEFIRIAKTVDISFPSELEHGNERQTKSSNRNEAGEDELGPKERQSLLKLVLGMAMDKFNFDTSDNRHDATANIKNALERKGIYLGEDSILKWLKIAAEEVGPN